MPAAAARSSMQHGVALTVLAFAALSALDMHRRRRRRLQRGGTASGLGKQLFPKHSALASSCRAVSEAGCTSRGTSSKLDELG